MTKDLKNGQQRLPMVTGSTLVFFMHSPISESERPRGSDRLLPLTLAAVETPTDGRRLKVAAAFERLYGGVRW